MNRQAILAPESLGERLRATRDLTMALAEETQVNAHALAYLNRLSDHLFVTARHVAAASGGDVLWQPGATRT